MDDLERLAERARQAPLNDDDYATTQYSGNTFLQGHETQQHSSGTMAQRYYKTSSSGNG